MRSVGTGRAVLAAGVSTVAAVALAGCSAGQVAETALKRTSNQGVNADNANSTVGIRDFAVVYNGVEGYPAGGDAPLEGGIYNLTTQPVTVLVSSAPAPTGAPNEEIVSARQIGLVGNASASAPSTGSPSGAASGAAVPSGPATPSGAVVPSGAASPPGAAVPSGAASPPGAAAPSGSASASAPATPPESAAQPARLVLPPSGFYSFEQGAPQSLWAIGLTGALKPGQGVNLVFEFSNGAAPLILPVPVSTPLTPAPRGSVEPKENEEAGTAN